MSFLINHMTLHINIANRNVAKCITAKHFAQMYQYPKFINLIVLYFNILTASLRISSLEYI
jgi:hypothetical protein